VIFTEGRKERVWQRNQCKGEEDLHTGEKKRRGKRSKKNLCVSKEQGPFLQLNMLEDAEGKGGPTQETMSEKWSERGGGSGGTGKQTGGISGGGE